MTSKKRRGLDEYLKFVHVNSKLGIDSTYALYQTILQKISPESTGRGYSLSEMLRQIVFYPEESGEYLFLWWMT